MGSAAAMTEPGFLENREPGRGITPTTSDLRTVAQSIALEQRRRVLVLVGRLDGAKGLPRSIDRYSPEIELRMIASMTSHIMTGIFEVKDEDALCGAIDQLQESGGYRATVINIDGSIDPAYTI